MIELCIYDTGSYDVELATYIVRANTITELI
uniref:Uncharacterized protein n=1 Tax=Lepeophtheirus salmonis TaxID=72036 RepID=A0A0K2UZ92_LEPSM